MGVAAAAKKWGAKAGRSGPQMRPPQGRRAVSSCLPGSGEEDAGRGSGRGACTPPLANQLATLFAIKAVAKVTHIPPRRGWGN